MSSPSLGPHVVGQRVVVRRILPGQSGPTGGPAFTDVLGTCTSWGEVAVIETDAGPVSVPVALIVSGKPVPPRPSTWLRVPARDAELHTGRLWPGVVAEELGEWQLRVDPHPVGRLIKRANSALAMGSPGVPVDAALERVRSFYAGHERTPMLQVELGGDVEAEAVDAGWAPLGRGDAAFLLAPVAQLARRLRIGEQQSGARPRLVAEDGDRPHAEVVEGGLRIAGGSGVLDGDWLAIHDLVVDPEHRRRGLATVVLEELVGWAAEWGARVVWLHVELDNEPARALYERLGFIEHHRCRYLTCLTSAAGSTRW